MPRPKGGKTRVEEEGAEHISTQDVEDAHDGRGVGFCVRNIVIDKNMLGQIALKLYGFLGSSIPIVLAYSIFSQIDTNQLGACEALTPEQAALLVSKLSGASGASGVLFAVLYSDSI